VGLPLIQRLLSNLTRPPQFLDEDDESAFLFRPIKYTNRLY